MIAPGWLRRAGRSKDASAAGRRRGVSAPAMDVAQNFLRHIRAIGESALRLADPLLARTRARYRLHRADHFKLFRRRRLGRRGRAGELKECNNDKVFKHFICTFSFLKRTLSASADKSPPGDFECAFGAADHDGEKRQAERVSLCGRTRIDAAQDGHSNAALEQRA
jgi:hypothetical protein